MKQKRYSYPGLLVLLLTIGFPLLFRVLFPTLSEEGRAGQWIPWLFLLLSTISCVYLYFLFQRLLIRGLHIALKTIFLLLTYAGLLLLLKAMDYQTIFHRSPVLAKVALSKAGLLSPLEWLMSSIIILGVILNYRQGAENHSKKAVWLPLPIYGFISLSLWIMAWAIKTLFFDTPMPLNFKNLLSLDIQVVFNLMSITLLILSHYFGVQHLIRYLYRQNIAFPYRAAGMALGIGVALLLAQLIPISISPAFAFGITLLFLPLWDIYMDNRTNNLSWTLFLLLPYSIFPGFLFIKYFQQILTEKGAVQARYLSQGRDWQTERELLDLSIWMEKEYDEDPGHLYWPRISMHLLQSTHLRGHYQWTIKDTVEADIWTTYDQLPNTKNVFIKIGVSGDDSWAPKSYLVYWKNKTLILSPTATYQPFEEEADPGLPVFNRYWELEDRREHILNAISNWYFHPSLPQKDEVIAHQVKAKEMQLFFGAANGRNLILAKSMDNFIEPIAIASLFFILLLSSLFIIHLFSTFGMVREGFTIFAIDYDSLSTRIQSGTVATILISFILVGMVSFSFLQNSATVELGKEIETEIQQLFLKLHPNEKLAADELSNFTYLQSPRAMDYPNPVVRFLRHLVAAYALLLSIAIIIAIVITNSITQPIASIGDKLSNLSLEKNQPLEWDRQDEIGRLVDTYNQMIEKIAFQAKQLKRSEREEAWREMAKQVAHEIKNPLTPMKLNVQYLLRAGDQQDPAQMQNLINRISNTLIEQIDSLSRIAAEFSNFAQMPKIQLSEFSLNQLLQSTVHLYQDQMNEELSVQLEMPEDDIWIKADKEQLMRVLTNLIKNGIQAIPEDRKGCIRLQLTSKDQKARICVRDNGSGIPEEIQPKVFVPNFTTKSSGTGLGLAISKNIIEAVNGRIYFETEQNKGTSFFIDLPIIESVQA